MQMLFVVATLPQHVQIALREMVRLGAMERANGNPRRPPVLVEP